MYSFCAPFRNDQFNFNTTARISIYGYNKHLPNTGFSKKNTCALAKSAPLASASASASGSERSDFCWDCSAESEVTHGEKTDLREAGLMACLVRPVPCDLRPVLPPACDPRDLSCLVVVLRASVGAMTREIPLEHPWL